MYRLRDLPQWQTVTNLGHALRSHRSTYGKYQHQGFGCLLLCGRMNIYEEAKYPWLAPEKALIREAIAWGKYVISICLGGQLNA